MVGNAEVEELERALRPENLNLPAEPKVERIEVRDIVDHVGDDAYRVTVVLEKPLTGRNDPPTMPIRKAILDAVFARTKAKFPYIRMVSVSELAEIAASR
jgi:hypothetical protein